MVGNMMYGLIEEEDRIEMQRRDEEYYRIVCPVAAKVAKMVADRAEIGLKKYGVTMRREDYDAPKMVQMAIEEALDFVVYMTRLKELLEEANGKK